MRRKYILIHYSQLFLQIIVILKSIILGQHRSYEWQPFLTTRNIYDSAWSLFMNENPEPFTSIEFSKFSKAMIKLFLDMQVK